MMMMIPPPSHDHEYTELGIHKTIASNISTTMRRGSNPPPQSTSSTVSTTTSCGSKNFDSSSYSGPLQCRPREFDDSKELPEPGRVSAGVKPSSPASPPPPPNLPSTHRPRSFNDATNPNAALHRALLAIKKQQQRMATNASNAAVPDDGRSITNPDARTLSMRERGRWGNSKMQQHIMFSSCGATHGKPDYDGIRVSADGIRVNSSPSVDTSCGQYSRQPLQHVRCLHCGSFSTTPVMGSHHSSGAAAKNVGGGGGGSMRGGGGSHSFGRRSAVVRDYSWQQELYEKKVKADQPTPPPPAPAPAPAHRFEAESGDGQFNARLHHHSSAAEEAQFCRYPDNGFPMGGSDPSSVSGHHLRFGQHQHHHHYHHQHNPWTWQGRYMLLCQAIAAGAFMDEELSHMATAAGYSCAACEWGGGFRRPGGGGGGATTPGASESGFGTTATSERMMELEAFSGPLGYVSESKGNAMHSANLNSSSSSSYYAAAAAAEQATMRRRRGGGGKWWSRISGLARNKSAEHHHHHHQTAEACATTPRRAAAPAAQSSSSSTAQCAGCGQRLWVHDELSRAATKRLCPDCLISSPASPMGYMAADQRENEYRRRPPPMRFAYKAAAAAAAAAAASASGSSRPCPKRWRLMRLCRYLLGL